MLQHISSELLDYFTGTDKFKSQKYNSSFLLGTNKIDWYKTTRIC